METKLLFRVPTLALLFLASGAIAGQQDFDLRPIGPVAAWEAENVRQGFRARFGLDGMRVEPRDNGQAAWTFELDLLRYGRPGRLVPAVSIGRPAVLGNRIEYRRENLVEWYVNRSGGLEHGFDVDERPTGPDRDEVVFELGLDTDLHPVFSTDGQAVEFFRGRELALRYSKLLVTDARGDVLPSRMEGFVAAGERGIRLVVDDSTAHYPITVDPIVTTSSWTAFGPHDSSAFGHSVAAAGDVNGDGYGDVIVGAPNAANGESNEGMAFVYLGSPTGLAATPVWSMESNQANALCGFAVSTAGDVNADGYADVIVGCPYHPGGGSLRGQTRVYLGSATGPQVSPVLTVNGTQDVEILGISVSTAGDFNNDGYSDIIIGQSGYNSFVGRATIYRGGPSNLTFHLAIDGTPPEQSFGAAVAGGGDFNADGYSDVAIGSPNGATSHDGEFTVVFGASAGDGGSISKTHPTGATGTHFGAALAFVGDTTGGGPSNLAVTAFLHDDGPLHAGKVWVFYNSANLAVAWSATASTARSVNYGNAVAAAGDVDDDGFADVLVADKNFGVAGTQYGRAEIVENPFVADGPGPVWNSESAVTPEVDDLFGFSVAATDVNGDGRPDVIVGSLGMDDTPDDDAGAVMVFHSGPATGETGDPVTTDTNSLTPYTAVVGDLNGDGFQDIAAGIATDDLAKVYLGGKFGTAATPDTTLSGTAGSWFGRTLAGAGDVNGDGYEDLLVGAPLYEGTEVDEGQALLFLGGATGVSTTPAWTFEPGQAGANLSYEAMAGLGDINGDGYADVGIGALNWSGDEAFEGTVFVFHGSASGLSPTFDLRLEADVVNAAFGARVDSAGDVNGDGYSDVLVATPYYDNGETNEGAAFLYLGGPSGLNPVPVWQTESNIPEQRYGFKAVGAGDLDGDGYADLAIGAPHPNGLADSFVWIFNGGPFGPATTPDQALQGLNGVSGLWLTALGDANADGFSDLLIGANASFEIGVYLGGSAGLATSPSSTLAGIATGVAGGDVNGDGYVDVVDPTGDGFEVFYAHGSNGNPRDRSVKLRREIAAITPIAPLGVSDDETQVRFRTYRPYWIGWAPTRVEAEFKPYGVPFDGIGTTFLPWLEPMFITDEQIDGLTPGTLYHWRTRHWYDPIKWPGFTHGPWLPSPDNAWSEPDFRTAGNAAASAVPDGNMVAGAPLTVGMNTVMGQRTISLSWGEACGGEVTDYAIYIGDIGDYTSHVPCTCSTGGLTSFGYPPDPVKDQYYLVVPINKAGQREGGYGRSSNGEPRPTSLAACYPAGEPATCNP